MSYLGGLGDVPRIAILSLHGIVTVPAFPPLCPSRALRLRDPFAPLGCLWAGAKPAVKSASFPARHSPRLARRALPGSSAANDGTRTRRMVEAD